MPQTMPASAVLLPGFGGTARQPLLVALDGALSARGVPCARLAIPRFPRTEGLEHEQRWLSDVLAPLPRPRLVVGRSFSGRVVVRLAAAHPDRVDRVAVVSHPVRPPSGRRPLDEAALHAVRVPTLILQGSADPLGPWRVLRALSRGNPWLEVEVVGPRVGHDLPARAAKVAVERVAAWAAPSPVGPPPRGA